MKWLTSFGSVLLILSTVTSNTNGVTHELQLTYQDWSTETLVDSNPFMSVTPIVKLCNQGV